MKAKRKIVILLVFFIVLTVGFGVSRTNTYSPIGAIRYKCMLQGQIISAIFLQAKKTEIEMDGEATVYKVTKFVPYDKATDTYLDQWNVMKNKNGTYSAVYGVG